MPTKKDDSAPWYADGLQFQCSQCGDCCTGGPGYVWVSDEEISQIATTLGISIDEFEKQYVRRARGKKSLRELPDSNYDCVLLDGKTRKCMVYDVRPRQCRTWPFWKSNVKNQAAWKATCEVCPGSGQGPIVPLASIEKQLAVIDI